MQKQSIGGMILFTVFLAVAACGGSTAPSTPVVIFSDDFAGPGGNWAQLPPPDSRGGSFRDTITGNPRPSLALDNFCRPIPFTDPKLNQCTPTSSTVGSSGSFDLSASAGVTVSVDVLLQPLTGGGSASARVSILSTASLFAVWAAVDVNLDKRTESYSICIDAAAPCSSVAVPFSSDGRFHTYRLVVAANGSARWQRDGLTQLSGSATVNGRFLIYLTAIALDVAGTNREYPVAHFDNVLATRP